MESNGYRGRPRGHRDGGSQGYRHSESEESRPYRPRTQRVAEVTEQNDEPRAEGEGREERPRREAPRRDSMGSYRPRTLRRDLPYPTEREEGREHDNEEPREHRRRDRDDGPRERRFGDRENRFPRREGYRGGYGDRDSRRDDRFAGDRRSGEGRYGRRDRDEGRGYSGYRPRFPSRDGEYPEREDRRDRQEGGYRPRFASRDGGRFGDRDGRYGRREGGYGSRFAPRDDRRFGDGEEGEYRPRRFPRGEERFGSRDGRYGRDEERPRYGSRDERPRRGDDRFGYGQDRRRDDRREYGRGRGEYGAERRMRERAQREYNDSRKQQSAQQRELDPNEPIRLNRYIAYCGVCSRREADIFIEQGEVQVNGVVVNTLGERIIPAQSEVVCKGDKLSVERKVYILLNKPKDCCSTTEDPHATRTVLDVVGDVCKERIYPVGRLDRNTTGLLLLTNDGELTEQLTHPSYNKRKVYEVELDRVVTADDMQRLRTGIELEDGTMSVDSIEYTRPGSRQTVGVEIHSGQNRIVRRLFEALGYQVEKLDRVYYAGLTKRNLPRGEWRFLTPSEITMLKSGRYE